jgi:hypothetical protein
LEWVGSCRVDLGLDADTVGWAISGVRGHEVRGPAGEFTAEAVRSLEISGA